MAQAPKTSGEFGFGFVKFGRRFPLINGLRGFWGFLGLCEIREGIFLLKSLDSLRRLVDSYQKRIPDKFVFGSSVSNPNQQNRVGSSGKIVFIASNPQF